MLELAQQDELTEIELDKFRRMRSIMSTSDINKAVDILAKLTGAYEPEKKEVTNTYKVSFGNEAQLKENNKEVIDIDHEEED
jgi:hypothetical protein